jgi:integrase/recombinase XerD
MSTKTKQQRWSLASVALQDAFTDFLLSRQAMNCSPTTITFYKQTAGVFLAWCEFRGVQSPESVSGRFVREYLSELAAKGKKDTTLNAHARAIRTLLIFWHEEGYIPSPVKFELPKLEKKRLPVLTVEELQKVVSACNIRDKAIVLLMADSGLRRQEVINLNWEDVDFESGRVRVKQGKGKKDRISVIGAKTKKALMRYRRNVEHSPSKPLFQSRTNERLTGTGLLIIYRRLSQKTGIKITPHAMRRTWTILSLRAGMRPLHLQNLGGWTDLTMVDHYAQMIDDDLVSEHRAHSPIDSL